MKSFFSALAAWAVTTLVSAPAIAVEDEFVPLFNGRDFAGWTNVNCALDTWGVRDGMIYCTGVPTGVLRTTRQYQNFILELEWKHLRAGGNSGVFVWSDPVTALGQPFTRAVEVQVLDATDPKGMWTGHGDVFPIHGATFVPDRPHPGGWMRCLPNEYRAKPTGQWNHYRIECRDGRISLAVNGKAVSGGHDTKPRRGYICLESEGGEIYFRNLRLRELPGPNLPPEQIAGVDEGFHSLYSGIDLSGWKQTSGHAGHWTPKNWILDYDGKSEARDKDLWTEKEYGDFVLIADWRLSGTPELRKFQLVRSDGGPATASDESPKMIEVPDAGESGVLVRGPAGGVVTIWCSPAGSGGAAKNRGEKIAAEPGLGAITPKRRADKKAGEWNRFVITVRGDRISVVLNGQSVIENAPLAGIPVRGAIGLQHRGAPVEFANLYVRELN